MLLKFNKYCPDSHATCASSLQEFIFKVNPCKGYPLLVTGSIFSDIRLIPFRSIYPGLRWLHESTLTVHESL